MNTVMKLGIMSNYWILGSPKIVSIWTACVRILFLLNIKQLYALNAPAS